MNKIARFLLRVVVQFVVTFAVFLLFRESVQIALLKSAIIAIVSQSVSYFLLLRRNKKATD